MRALLVVSKAQATVRALSIRKAGATTLTLLAVSLCGPEPGTVWRARRAVAFYDRRQDTRAGAVSVPGPEDAVSAAKPLDNTPHLFAVKGAKRDGPNGSHRRCDLQKMGADGLLVRCLEDNYHVVG